MLTINDGVSVQSLGYSCCCCSACYCCSARCLLQSVHSMHCILKLMRQHLSYKFSFRYHLNNPAYFELSLCRQRSNFIQCYAISLACLWGVFVHWFCIDFIAFVYVTHQNEIYRNFYASSVHHKT